MSAGFSADQPQAVPVSSSQLPSFSDGMFQVSESLQTLSEFSAEDILSIKKEDAGSSSDYYSLESSPNTANFLDAARSSTDCYGNSNALVFDQVSNYLSNFNKGRHRNYTSKWKIFMILRSIRLSLLRGKLLCPSNTAPLFGTNYYYYFYPFIS